jgi:hypothetical protein
MARPEGELMLYAGRETRTPVAEIVAAMRARGTPVDWHAELLPEDPDPQRWNAGYFTEGGQSTHRVTISNDPLEQWARDEALEAHADALSPSLRHRLEAARFSYRLTASDGSRTSLRLLASLADTLAELTGAIILDLASDRFYEPDEYRAQHAALMARHD